MMIEVRLFAGLAEEAGTRSLALPADENMTVERLKHLLAERFPYLQNKIAQCMVAVNQEYAEDKTTVSNKDEIVLIPPVSGG